MNELMHKDEVSAARLDRLAHEARLYSESFAMNALQLGRVLTEAKREIPHGEWMNWVYENTGMSQKMAQDLMRSYQKFSGKPTLFTVEKSKLFKLLSLPEGKEDEFLEKNDVASMSVREVGEAVKQARQEEQAAARAEIARERRLRMEAESRANRQADQDGDISESVAQALRDKDRQIREERENGQHFAQLAREVGKDKIALERERNSLAEQLERMKDEHEAELERAQEKYSNLRDEYLSLKSARSRDDVAHVNPDTLTIEVFSAAVREFMGICARMPYMQGTFSGMAQAEKEKYGQYLRTIEGWARGARGALETVRLDGGDFVEE
ncbi:MAG: DUF3102 domain-containing protein [Clostridia bacterium]|nr:DUF3102 domain-containing protein [Clostridia bacterium]